MGRVARDNSASRATLSQGTKWNCVADVRTEKHAVLNELIEGHGMVHQLMCQERRQILKARRTKQKKTQYENLLENLYDSTNGNGSQFCCTQLAASGHSTCAIELLSLQYLARHNSAMPMELNSFNTLNNTSATPNSSSDVYTGTPHGSHALKGLHSETTA